MISNNTRRFRAVALVTGGLIAGTFALQPAPAQAVEKKKLYKGGAIGLGVLGAYWILKGKTIQGAAAGAGAYYAYKKGKDVEQEDRYDDNYDSRNYDSRSSDSRYDYRNDRYQDYNYAAPARSNTSNGGTVVLR